MKLRLSDVMLRLQGRKILDGVSLDVPPGRLLAVLGGAGSGKSALLHLLADGGALDAGSVLWRDAPLHRVAAHRRGFGVVAQCPALFPNMSLAENVAYPLRLRRMAARDRTAQVEAALESVLLENAGRLPRQAGPADCQRAALARATVFGPRLLLLDEPLGHQPAEARPALLAALRRLQLMLGITTIMATRVAADAMALADQLAVLQQGRIEQVGAPASIYGSPVSAVAALATGEANLLPGVVHAIDEDGIARVGLACGPVVEGTAAPSLRVRARCLFFLRPEHIAVAPVRAADMGEDALDATLLEALHLGDTVRMRLLLGSGAELLVKRPLAAGMRAGQAVAVAWQPGHAGVFPE